MKHLSYIEIDQAAVVHNVKTLKGLCPAARKVVGVVKANAYGHGLAPVVDALEPHVDYFAVDDVDELIELKRYSLKPCLVLGYVSKAWVEEAIAIGAELAVYDTERLESINQAAEARGIKARVHLKIDALLGRQGVLPDDVPAFLEALKAYPSIEVVAAYSHFANIEDTTDLTHAHAQTAEFERGFAATGLDERHESATSGVMTGEGLGSRNQWVRLGIGLYGLYPSDALRRTHGELGLRHVMRWVTHLAQVKTIPARHPVGYGLTYIAPRAMKIGIVPQGYSDGYDRGLSNTGEVLIHGKRCAVLGRVAMNMFAVDLTSAPEAVAEDEAVLLGRQGDEQITAEEIALKTNTINYEVVAKVSPLLPRVGF